MTWGELKQVVIDHGGQDADQIDYIDILSIDTCVVIEREPVEHTKITLLRVAGPPE